MVTNTGLINCKQMNSSKRKSPGIFEYEREPVPWDKTKNAKSFWGLFSSEHVAGTELLIGPLFVVHGVAAFNVLIGLIIGNILAVLSWRYLSMSSITGWAPRNASITEASVE